MLEAAEAVADVANPKATIIASTATILRRIERVTFRHLSLGAVDYGLDRQVRAMITIAARY